MGMECAAAGCSRGGRWCGVLALAAGCSRGVSGGRPSSPWPCLVEVEKNFAKFFCIFDQKFRVVNEV